MPVLKWFSAAGQSTRVAAEAETVALTAGGRPCRRGSRAAVPPGGAPTDGRTAAPPRRQEYASASEGSADGSLGSKMDTVDREQEVTQWFAAAGLLLVVAGGSLAAVWFNRFP